MTEKTQSEEKNTVALIGMIFSIIWLVLLITIIGARLGLFFLLLWLVLWIIWLFWRPKWKAIVAVIISGLTLWLISFCICYIRKSIQPSALQFTSYMEEKIENNQEIMESDDFSNLVQQNFEQIISSRYPENEDLKNLYESSNWNNAMEKVSNIFFWLLEESIDVTIEQINSNTENNIIEDTENIEIEEIEIPSYETTQNETNEIFSNAEITNIEEIIWLLE